MGNCWRCEGANYLFENDVVHGSYLTAGEYQGMRELVHRPTGLQTAAGETLPGLLAPYRVFGNGRRYDDVRDRPARPEISDDRLRIRYEADDANPFDLDSHYRWTGGVLDVTYAILPHVELRRFELNVSSYLSAGFRAFVSTQSNEWGEDAPRIVPVDVNPMTDVYAMFPRDESAMATIFDGRWDLPPYPVRWTVPGWLDQPFAYRRHAGSGVTVLAMGDPEETHAIGISVNDPPDDPDPEKGYQSIYFYFFGSDLPADRPAEVRLRWIVGKDLSEDEMLRRWEAFRKTP